MIVERLDVALPAIGTPPVCALEQRPPLAVVTKIDRMIRRREDQRSREDHVGQGIRIVLWIRSDFGKRDVPGGSHEFLELAVRHRRAVDPESVDARHVGRGLFRIVPIRSHAEGTARNKDRTRCAAFANVCGRCLVRRDTHVRTLVLVKALNCGSFNCLASSRRRESLASQGAGPSLLWQKTVRRRDCTSCAHLRHCFSPHSRPICALCDGADSAQREELDGGRE
ncbi:hypothetical protein ABIA95_008008 [Bradyrhizobium sp. LA8.1]